MSLWAVVSSLLKLSTMSVTTVGSSGHAHIGLAQGIEQGKSGSAVLQAHFPCKRAHTRMAAFFKVVVASTVFSGRLFQRLRLLFPLGVQDCWLQGLSIATPVSSKSVTFLVTTVMP